MQRSAEEGCEIEFKDGSVTGEDCAKLERLEQFARTMMSSGKIGNFVRTLYSLRSYAKKHAEERAAAEGRDAPGTFQHFLNVLLYSVEAGVIVEGRGACAGVFPLHKVETPWCHSGLSLSLENGSAQTSASPWGFPC